MTSKTKQMVSVTRDCLNQVALLQMPLDELQEQAVEFLCEPRDEQPEPAVILDLVQNKVYGGLHIRKWENIGDLVEGVYKLYAEQLAPVAAAMPDRENLRDIIAQAIGGDTYDCVRVWSAWGVGTMSEDDFVPVVDQEARLYEIADACLDEFARLNSEQKP